MRPLIPSIGLLVALSACLDPSRPRPAPTNNDAPAAAAVSSPHIAALIDVEGEVARLRAALMREVPGVIVDTAADERGWIARTQAAVATGGQTIDRPQLVVVADRNPDVQQMRIVLARPDGAWESLGGTKVSTGQRGRFDYYLTPTGVFVHTDAILDWRAEGTFNPQHIRGLGLKGMRVWDFGWQRLSEIQSVSAAMPVRHTEILKKALGQVSLGSKEIKRFRKLLEPTGINARPVYRVCFLNEFARFGIVARPCQRAIIIRSTRSRERAIEAAKKRFARLEGIRDWRDHAKIIEVSIIEDDPSQGVPRR